MKKENNTNIKEKWIVDTDPGCDDLMALIYLNNKENTEIEMICISEGNCKMHHVQNNIKKFKKISENLSLKVFSGSKCQLNPGALNAYEYHYEDGLGNIEELKKIDVTGVEIAHDSLYSAVQIVKLVKANPGVYNFLGLAPLTNIALALKLDPSIADKFKTIIIMGGSYDLRGNVTAGTEFNFHNDYAAARIVFSMMKNIIVCPWEPTENEYFNLELLEKSKEVAMKKFGAINEDVLFYVKLILAKYTKDMKGIQICDLYAIMAFYNPSLVTGMFLANEEILIDSEKLNGALMLSDIEKCNILLKDFLDNGCFLLKQQEKNLYFSNLNIDIIVEEFSYILKPKKIENEIK